MFFRYAHCVPTPGTTSAGSDAAVRVADSGATATAAAAAAAATATATATARLLSATVSVGHPATVSAAIRG